MLGSWDSVESHSQSNAGVFSLWSSISASDITVIGPNWSKQGIPTMPIWIFCVVALRSRWSPICCCISNLSKWWKTSTSVGVGITPIDVQWESSLVPVQYSPGIHLFQKVSNKMWLLGIRRSKTATLMSVITGPRLVSVATLVRYVENVNRRAGPLLTRAGF